MAYRKILVQGYLGTLLGVEGVAIIVAEGGTFYCSHIRSCVPRTYRGDLAL